jgi:hypothetical protein
MKSIGVQSNQIHEGGGLSIKNFVKMKGERTINCNNLTLLIRIYTRVLEV